MIACKNRCFDKVETDSARKEKSIESRKEKGISGIIDHKVVLLSVASAAVASDCDSCLKEVVPELKEAGISEADIRNAVQSGWFLGADANLGAKVFKKACYHPN